LFSSLVVCTDMISKGFSFVAFFASVKVICDCIRLSCLVFIQSAFHGVRSRLFCGHNLKSNAFIQKKSWIFFKFYKLWEKNSWKSVTSVPRCHFPFDDEIREVRYVCFFASVGNIIYVKYHIIKFI
jgi:hypothetical protein